MEAGIKARMHYQCDYAAFDHTGHGNIKYGVLFLQLQNVIPYALFLIIDLGQFLCSFFGLFEGGVKLGLEVFHG